MVEKSATKCLVYGCGGARRTKGFCGKHYQRLWKHGSPFTRKSRANGEGGISTQGYIVRSIGGTRRAEHVIKAEAALGRKLPKYAEVHHVDLDKTNNENTNLVICPSNEYHQLLHIRQRAIDECGDPSYRKCTYCQSYDDPKNLIQYTNSAPHHRKCRQKYRMESN